MTNRLSGGEALPSGEPVHNQAPKDRGKGIDLVDEVEVTPPPRGRQLFLGGLIAGGIGLLTLSGLLGWWLNDQFGDAGEIVVNRPITVLSEQVVAADVVPNVLGIDADTARQVFLDAGIDPAIVKSVNVPYAGQAGVVIDQQPAPGAAVTNPAVLSVSAAAKMPQLVGRPGDEARKELSDLGARVVVKLQYVAGRPEGSVIATAPAAGALLTTEVTLTTAEAISSVFLTKLQALQTDCSTGSAALDGTTYDEGIVCSLDPSGPRVTEYVLNRRLTSFSAVIGTSDTSAATEPAHFTVLVDGKPAFQRTVPFGKGERISVPLTGALRLRLEIRGGTTGASSSPTAVWAEPQLQAGGSVIDALTAASGP